MLKMSWRVTLCYSNSSGNKTGPKTDKGTDDGSPFITVKVFLSLGTCHAKKKKKVLKMFALHGLNSFISYRCLL